MIKVQDWIASIPDEEKHIAYVGEGKSEQREFLLCGQGWETYKNWSFHLDMAFDPISITTHDSRQVVQTTHNSTEQKEEAGVIVDEITTKETYTIDNVQVKNNYLTDIAPLDKAVTADGICLTWTILRQHTVLPGKLWATIRAVNNEEQRIKKSAIMVFEVDPAICAVPAAVPPISEFEQMEMRMDALRMLTEMAADDATDAAKEAIMSADEAIRSATTATSAASNALNCMWQANTAADEAQQNADSAAASAQQAQTAADSAATHAASAANHAASAALSNQGALLHLEAANDAVEQCNRSVALCKEYANASKQPAHSYNCVNVRDYGAVGDGVADDRQAIIDAFTEAKSMLPCEVYFPAGIYGISNGITVDMEYGTGGLSVRGAGRDITQIKYLESYDPNQAGNMWYAIRIWPVGMPNTKPATEEDYLHDISYTGLTVYDTDPIAHAWNTEKGDPSKEETHGFDIQYCKRVSVTDCNIVNVGDEAIDIFSCHDVVVMNNHIVNSPAAGSAGGAISIGDGSKNVVVSGNTVNGTAEDETLESGTVITKRNFGIAVESLTLPISDVSITGNIVTNVRGNGINITATQDGSTVCNVVVSDNVISNCYSGIKTGDTNYRKGNISITNNMISGCGGSIDTDGYAIYTGTKTYNVLITGNKIQDIAGTIAVKVGVADFALVSDNLFVNIVGQALYTTGDVAVRNCTFANIGTGGAATSAIEKYGTAANKLTVSGCRLTGIQPTKGILNVDVVENTEIELANGGQAVSGNYLSRVIGGQFNNYFKVVKDGAVVQGLTIYSENCSTDAITIAANGVSVTGCNIYVGTAKKAIKENDGFKGNLVANNIVNGALSTGAVLILADNEGTVCVNNVDLRTVLA